MSRSSRRNDEKPDCPQAELSLIEGDPAYRLQKRLHLIPARGMGVGRRALMLVAITWLPMLGAAWWGRVEGAAPAEPLLAHYGIHARCLIAIPLMIVAEGLGHALLPRMLAQFESSGLVRSRDRPCFAALLQGMAQLRDRALPWVLILGVTLAWASTAIALGQLGDVDWGQHERRPPGQGAGFAEWWFALVVRPIFIALLLAWLWRTLLVFILMRRLSRLPLLVVPAHPDRRGGLGFIERIALIFSPVALAISAVAASAFAHDVAYHGVDVMDVRFELAGIAILVSLVFLLPFLSWSGLLLRAKQKAMLDYGALLAQHGRLVYRRWILKEQIEEMPLLDAPELGPVADIQTMYQAVESMRVHSIGKLGVAAIVVPATLPVLVVVLIQLPVREVALRVLKAVM